MRFIALTALSAVAACTSAMLATPAGQVFCSLQTQGGGSLVVGLIDAEATAVSPAVAPVAILAANTAQSDIDSACADAGRLVGGTGSQAVPPATSVPSVPVVRPSKGA
jgi:hypothetical protein